MSKLQEFKPTYMHGWSAKVHGDKTVLGYHTVDTRELLNALRKLCWKSAGSVWVKGGISLSATRNGISYESGDCRYPNVISWGEAERLIAFIKESQATERGAA